MSARHTRPVVHACSNHAAKSSYVHENEMAEKRMAAGQEQVQCPRCGLWIWPDDPSLTFDAAAFPGGEK